MKNLNKKIVLLIVFAAMYLNLFLNQKLHSQQKKIENIFQKCYYDALGSKSISYKRQFEKFEENLIKDQLLKDKSASSYFNLIRSLKVKKKYIFPPSYSLDSLAFILEDKEILSSNTKCYKKISNHKDYNDFIYKNNKIKSTGDINEFKKEGFSRFIDVITKEDLESDFFKHRVLLTVEMILLLSD